VTERERQIIESAMQLAEQGGFEAVRLRDVAASSGVGLGTLYARFRSKEDLLLAGVSQEIDKLRDVLEVVPIPGDTPLSRVTWFFTLTTRTLLQRPNFAGAVLRSLGAGDERSAAAVIGFHTRVTRLITSTMRGLPPSALEEAALDAAEERVGLLLQQVWYATLVGWQAGMHTEAQVIEHVGEAAALLLAGLESRRGV